MPEQHNKFREPAFVGPAWHADGTPYSAEDYERAGYDVPEPEVLKRWQRRTLPLVRE